MKKMICMTASFVLAVTMAGCTQEAANNSTAEEQSIEQIVDQCFDHLENAEIEEAKLLTTGNASNSLTSLNENMEEISTTFSMLEADSSLQMRADTFTADLYRLFFNNHTIDSITKDASGDYHAAVTVTHYDSTVIADAFSALPEYVDYGYSEEDTSVDPNAILTDMMDQFEQVLVSLEESDSYVERSSILILQKVDGTWLISDFSEAE